MHLGQRNLNVEPPFSPVGRTVYYFTILLFLLFYFFISIRFQAEVFCMLGRQSYTSAAPQHFPEVFLHLGQPSLHVGSRFCMSAKRIPLATSHSRQPGASGPRNAMYSYLRLERTKQGLIEESTLHHFRVPCIICVVFATCRARVCSLDVGTRSLSSEFRISGPRSPSCRGGAQSVLRANPWATSLQTFASRPRSWDPTKKG